MRVVSSDSLERHARAWTGDIVLSPPDVPQRFTNRGPGRSRMICIHASPAIVTEFLK
jgi:mannose-6-phosphate isomerase-like protein (cupin superfamily)